MWQGSFTCWNCVCCPPRRHFLCGSIPCCCCFVVVFSNWRCRRCCVGWAGGWPWKKGWARRDDVPANSCCPLGDAAGEYFGWTEVLARGRRLRGAVAAEEEGKNKEQRTAKPTLPSSQQPSFSVATANLIRWTDGWTGEARR